MTDIDKTLLDLIEHPVFILKPDQDGVPRYAAYNAFACSALGKPEAEVIGQTAAELYPGRLGKIAFNHHREAVKSGTGSVYEIRLPLSGQQRLIRTTLRPVVNAEGTVERIIGSSTDISGGQIFREMKTEMETITNEFEEFVSLAAHDLRTPMRNVSQVAEMLREDFQDLGDGKIELIGVLEDVGEKALRLISDVLAHAQATSSVKEMVEFDFGDLAAEVSAVLDPLNDCQIRFTSGKMEGDRTAVQIILRNLVDNSIKHARPVNTPAGDTNGLSKVKLTIDAKDLQNGYFEVEVRDNGAGFSEAALQFLNGGALRVDSGFGLLGVRRLITARGGSVRVENIETTDGAIVAFTLPGTFIPEVPDQAQSSDLQLKAS